MAVGGKHQSEIDSSSAPATKKQKNIHEAFSVSQATADKLIKNYIIQEMRPLSTVDKSAFKELVTGLNSTVHVLSRKTLSIRINNEYLQMKDVIKNACKQTLYLCTTADIWSCQKRSYFGITAHWIADDLSRKSCALACRRFTGTHSYSYIAEFLHEVFAEYGLEHGQILATVTDNGSNFVKAFKEYSKENVVDTGNEEPEATGSNMESSHNQSVSHNSDSDEDEEQAEQSEVEFIELSSVLAADDDDIGIVLPPHQRCVAHTLNLIASHDALDSLKHSMAFKRQYNSAMGKCSALWTASGRPKAAEVVKNICGKQLLQPCATRWNSMYDSIQRTLEVKDKLQQLCTTLKMTTFKDMDIEFLEEFVLVMKPIAVSLDKLQGEKDACLAYFLPSILRIEQSLMETIPKLKYALPLAQAALKGLRTRYADAINMAPEVDHYILAAVTHPYFKMRWVPRVHEARVNKLFLDTYSSFVQSRSRLMAITDSRKENESEDDDNFFKFESHPSTAVDHATFMQPAQYLEDSSRNLDLLKSFPIIQDMFKRYNTVIPSSAPVERLFSSGGQIMTPRRNGLSDETFEKLLLLRQNAHFTQ